MTSVRLSASSTARSRGRRVGVASTSLVAITTFGVLAGLTGTAQAATTIPLAGAGVYGVLGTTVTNTGVSTVAGDVGGNTRTGTGRTGADSIVHTSGRDRGDVDAGKAGLTAAITNARGQTPATDVGTANLGLSSPLGPGVYTSGSDLALTGALVLDGGGSYDSVFVFRATAAISTAAASTVSLINGAQACNVFWEIGSSATLGAGSSFAGTVLATTSISVNAGATIDGRLLAGSAVTLISDVITRSGCRSGPVVPPPVVGSPVDAPVDAPVVVPPVGSPVVVPPVGSPATTPAGTPATTPAGTPATTPAGTTPAREARITYDQVSRVPVGSVDTGDGSTAVDRVSSPWW